MAKHIIKHSKVYILQVMAIAKAYSFYILHVNTNYTSFLPIPDASSH